MGALVQSAAVTSFPLQFGFFYRILTEWKNVDNVKAWLVAQGIDYSLFVGEGAWHGAKENSMAIELAGISRNEAIRIALAIKEMNDQEAILLQEIPVSSILL